MIHILHIDDLDGAVTLFKSTDEGTETIAVFDEEHREVIQDLLAEVRRLREENKTFHSTMMKYRNRLLETHSWSELRALEGEEE